MLHLKNKVIALAIGLSLTVEVIPGALAVPTDESKPSQAQCLEVVGKLAKGTPMSVAETEQAAALIKRCQAAFWILPDPNAPLPTATECINFYSLTFDAFRQNNVGKLETIPAEQQRSLLRCPEVIEARYMPSGSMLPTLRINDRFFIDKVAYRSQSPQRGDLILFQPTETLKKQNFKDAFIKRIIGLPGEKVKVSRGLVYINGKPLQEAYLADRPQYQYGSVVVPVDQYFVLGDNRNNSYDSHYWGFVPRPLIIGKAFAVFCPIERQQLLSNAASLSSERKAAISTLFKSMASVCAGIVSQQSASNSPAKQIVGSMNRAQQAFYLEEERFSPSLDQLGLGISAENRDYQYTIKITDEKRLVQNFGFAKVSGLKSYIGIVTLLKVPGTNELSTQTILCESDKPNTAIPPATAPTLSVTSEPVCPVGYSVIR